MGPHLKACCSNQFHGRTSYASPIHFIRNQRNYGDSHSSSFHEIPRSCLGNAPVSLYTRMAFELTVAGTHSIPPNLSELWPEALRPHGIACAIHPEFSPGTWKVDAMPSTLIGTELKAPALSGFEVNFRGDSAFFRSAMGRTSTEFALLCLCAAELACMTDGVYRDPQSGKDHQGEDARTAALAEIKGLLACGGRGLLTQHPFSAWT